jgi:hypothetical protein
MAAPYIEARDGAFVQGGWGIESNGEGAIVSTLDDMLLWCAELQRPRVVGAEIIAEMAAPLRYSNGQAGNYGLGLYTRRERGRRVFGHGGRMPGFRAEIAVYPDDGLALAILTNLHGIDAYTVGQKAAAAWFGDVAGAPTSPALPLGRFRAAASGDVIEIRGHGEMPVLAASSGPVPLVAAGGNWWEPASPVWDLRLGSRDGGLDAIYCGRRLRYDRIAEPPVPRTEEYAGDYRCPDLGTTYRVRADRPGGLSIRMQGELGYYDSLLEPIAPDLFRAAPADPRSAWNQPLLHFLRGADGRIDAVLYGTDRTRNLRFERAP